MSKANLVRDPREELAPPVKPPPEEYGTMIKLWLESPGNEDVGPENADRDFYEFVKESSHPAAAIVLKYFSEQQ